MVGSFYINTTNFTGFGHLYLFHAAPIFSTFNICELYRENLLSLVQNLTFKARCPRNPWTADQMDRILALRKNSDSCW